MIKKIIIKPNNINILDIRLIVGPIPLPINIEISVVTSLIILPILLFLKKLKSCSKYFLNIFFDKWLCVSHINFPLYH